MHIDKRKTLKTGLQAFSVCITVFIAACASSAPSTRPAYTGPDTVSEVQRQQIVGRWAAKELNPVNAQPSRTTIIEYSSDGGVKGFIKLAIAANAQTLEFEVTGGWSVEGDVISHKNITMKSTADNEAGQRLSKLVNSQSDISGVARIYELTNNRMVMVGTDGVAMEYIRQ